MRKPRPRLQLVRVGPGPVEPISPELVLVSPELAAAVRSVPDSLFVGEAEPSGVRAAEPRVEISAGSARFDTRDLVLERHGLALELEHVGGRPLWRLTLARGETIEAEGESVPREIAAMVQVVARDAALQPVPVRSDNAEIRRLEKQIGVQRWSLVRHEPGVRHALDPENLHQLRVACRRLRAHLRVARSLVDPAWASEITTVLRELGRASGPARDLDVLREHVREEASGFESPDRVAAAELIEQLDAERRQLQARLVAVLDGEPYRSMLDRLALPVESVGAPKETNLRRVAARELARFVARVRRLGNEPSDEQLHALRINVKRVRYAIELAGLPHSGRSRRVIGAATALQDILGEYQDAVTAEELLRAQAYGSDAPRVAFVAGRLADRQGRRRAELHLRLPPAWRELRRLSRKRT